MTCFNAIAALLWWFGAELTMSEVCLYMCALLSENLLYATLTEDLHEYLFSLTKINSKRTFTFTKKSDKVSVQRVSYSGQYTGRAHPAERTAPPRAFRGH